MLNALIVEATIQTRQPTEMSAMSLRKPERLSAVHSLTWLPVVLQPGFSAQTSATVVHGISSAAMSVTKLSR